MEHIEETAFIREIAHIPTFTLKNDIIKNIEMHVLVLQYNLTLKD